MKILKNNSKTFHSLDIKILKPDEKTNLAVPLEQFNSWEEGKAIPQALAIEKVTKQIILTNKIGKPLFFNMLEDSFGIVASVSNPMNYLLELIQNSTLEKTGPISWELTSKRENSQGKNLSLKFSFNATSHEEATKLEASYKKNMKARGVRAWMAYWAEANLQGSTECECRFIDVMKLCYPERKTTFAVCEKNNFWDDTKMIQHTVISVEEVIQKYNKQIVRWREQPLFTLLGGEKEIEAMNKFPEIVAFRVLSTNKQEKNFHPAIYKNTSLQGNVNRTLLAFNIQTRAAQLERGTKDFFFDWEKCINLCSLAGTAKTNPTEARKRVREEIFYLKKVNIIEDFQETEKGFRFFPKNQTRKTKTLKNST